MIEAESKEEREEIAGKTLEEKAEIARETVEEALNRYDPSNMVIGFTGGKDSSLTAYFVKEVCEEKGVEKPKFMFVDHGQHFQEIEEFVERISEDWGFEVVEARNDDLIEKADEPGETVPVEELNEKNRREVERLESGHEEVPWLMDTEAGNHLLKTVAMNELLEERGIEAVINGVRWDEQEARSEENFFSERSDPDHVRVHPILPFEERDVWEFTWNVIVPEEVDEWEGGLPSGQEDLPAGVSKDDLPISPKYWEGFRSLGSEVSTDRSDEQPAWLQDLEGTEERGGRAQDKEEIMKKLRELGYM
ncbi:MAG: phosphoadenosine phosphosulfate reductase family protein [Candidatus Nanohaloarchaea archaeon]|nr:phosphoadenosine phosphosulfate reductase family protein [Candidatus Nanohaloarchaea archaeon]